MDRFAAMVRFTAQPGQRAELAGILFEAAREMVAFPDCELYLVQVPKDEVDTVWVTEVWASKEAHAASLQDDDVRATIARARPLIAGIEQQVLSSIGGKGMD